MDSSIDSPKKTSSYDINGSEFDSIKLINSSAITLPTLPFTTFKNTALGIELFFLYKLYKF